MNHCDLLVTGGDVLDLEAPDSCLKNQAVAVIGDRIAEVAPSSVMLERWKTDRLIDATGCVVAPGFIDAHVHLSAFLATPLTHERALGPSMFGGGAPPETMMARVAEMTSTAVGSEVTAAVVRPVFAALLASGVTSVLDAGSTGLEGIVQAATETGIRLATGPSLADHWHREGQFGRRADTQDLLERASAFIKTYDMSASGRIRAVVSAVEVAACSDALLSGVAELATDHDLATHVHCLIDQRSDDLHRDLFGVAAIDRLATTGLLSHRCVAMHAGHADDHAVEVLANTGATVNHNPVGNMMLGWNTMRYRAVPKLLSAGVPVVLGSDYSPSMIVSAFDSMHAALMGHREAGGRDDALSVEAVVGMATNSGTAMGRSGQLGLLRRGQLADIMVCDTSGPHHLGSHHPVTAIGLRGRTSDVRVVIVNGNVVVDDGVVTTIDTEAAVAEATAVLQAMSG